MRISGTLFTVMAIVVASAVGCGADGSLDEATAPDEIVEVGQPDPPETEVITQALTGSRVRLRSINGSSSMSLTASRSRRCTNLSSQLNDKLGSIETGAVFVRVYKDAGCRGSPLSFVADHDTVTLNSRSASSVLYWVPPCDQTYAGCN